MKSVSNERLKELITTYSDMVYRLAIKRCPNPADADDIYQTVFLKLVQHAAKLDTEEHIKAWLIKVTINECNRHYTESWATKTASFEDEVDYEEPGTDSFEDDIVKADSFTVVREALNGLPPDYYEVLYLFYYEEMSVAEIGDALGLSQSNVKVRLNRARNKLKEILKQKGVTDIG